MRNFIVFATAVFLVLTTFAAAQDHLPLDLRSIPISDWLNAGEHSEIPWRLTVRDSYLRVDQRLEVVYSARISGKELNRFGGTHELFLVNRVSSPEGEWLHEPHIVRHTTEQLTNSVQAEFLMRVVAQPGDYVLWVVLYDRETGKHSVGRRRVRVSEIRGDPLPDLYSRMPLVEFPEGELNGNGIGFVESELYLPVRNKRPLQVELISLLSPPEQWTGRMRAVRAHTDSTLGALAALSQIDLKEGSLSITGLDLSRRQVMFEQRDFEHVQWTSLVAAMKKAQSPNISAAALQGAKNNGAFFREVLNQRLSDASSEGAPMRVLIVVTSSQLFESGSDLRPLQLDGDCNCRIYYLRFRLNLNDVFDHLEKFMKPLHPRVFNLMSARDLRKAIGEIVGDLERL